LKPELLLIDSYILAAFPKIIDLNSRYYKIITTTHVILDIKNDYNVKIGKKQKAELLERINSKVFDDNFEVIPVDLDSLFSIRNDKGNEMFSSSETSLIDLANVLKKNNTVHIVTMNDRLALAMRNYNIQSLNLNDVIEIYSRQTGKGSEILKYKIYYDRKELLSIRNKLLIGLVVAVILITAYFYKNTLIQRLDVAGTIFVTIVLAIGLFVFREKQRIAYGFVEFLVGLASVILIFYPTFDYNCLSLDFTFSIKFLGGLYIMVRGLDNILKGLAKTRTGEILRYKYGIGL